MAKKYYCSVCGKELIHGRRAVPGKGLILDLIDPHECEGYTIKSAPDESPTVKDLLDSIEESRKANKESVERSLRRVSGPGDKRKDVRSSTAPATLLDNIHSMSNSEPEGGTNDAENL